MFIVECINAGPRGLPRRRMVGPFLTFGHAHDWMEKVGAKRFSTLVIHSLKKAAEIRRND
jgi:hypothetical protein